MATLLVLYSNSARSWMTAEIFKNWFFKDFNPSVRIAHPTASTLRTPDEQIFVTYLPKNTTSKIQPCDAGIIKSFKALYKKELAMEMLDLLGTITNYLKEMTLKDSFYLTAKTWEAVSEATMWNCWSKALGWALMRRMLRKRWCHLMASPLQRFRQPRTSWRNTWMQTSPFRTESICDPRWRRR